jgi:uncharacterized NAD(P)/FAD-binding protein YdhS
MKTYNITIVGMGQRGLTILERIAALLLHEPIEAKLNIHVIDEATPGQGIHDAHQPEHLLINTIAAQVAIYHDTSVVGGGPLVPGMTFLEWMQKSGYRRIDGKTVISDHGQEIDENTYVPRALLGAYLTWAYDRIVESLPASARVFMHGRPAVNVIRNDDHTFFVELEGGYRIPSDFVFLATGHSGCGPDAVDDLYQQWVDAGKAVNSHAQYFRSPYPVRRLNAISSQARVALCGVGLTGADVISALTIGLGGRFEKISRQRLKYIACGREPKITVFTRQGLPAGGRAVNQKGTYGQYKARFFTMDFISRKRKEILETLGATQIDFDRDLWPTLRKEMAYVYHCTVHGEWLEPADYRESEEDLAAVEKIVTPLTDEACSDQETYRTFVRTFLEEDIANCFDGNVNNPTKAAADMLRDVRDNIRYAVDYSRLTPESHRRFLSYWCSISNRLASGPPKERNMELLALIDAGVVDFFGPSPRIAYDAERGQFKLSSTRFKKPVIDYFDVLIRAKVEVFEPERSTSPLIRNMLTTGLVTPYRNGDFKPSGIAIDENVNVITAEGHSLPNLWALGYVAEGSVFYTYVLPRPYANSRGLQDAGKIVMSMFDQIRKANVEEQKLSYAEA